VEHAEGYHGARVSRCRRQANVETPAGIHAGPVSLFPGHAVVGRIEQSDLRAANLRILVVEAPQSIELIEQRDLDGSGRGAARASLPREPRPVREQNRRPADGDVPGRGEIAEGTEIAKQFHQRVVARLGGRHESTGHPRLVAERPDQLVAQLGNVLRSDTSRAPQLVAQSNRQAGARAVQGSLHAADLKSPVQRDRDDIGGHLLADEQSAHPRTRSQSFDLSRRVFPERIIRALAAGLGLQHARGNSSRRLSELLEYARFKPVR